MLEHSRVMIFALLKYGKRNQFGNTVEQGYHSLKKPVWKYYVEQGCHSLAPAIP